MSYISVKYFNISEHFPGLIFW